VIIEQRSGQRVERWDTELMTYTMWFGDVLQETRPFNDSELAFVLERQADVAWQARRAEAIQLGRLAFASNKTYLGKVDAGTATNADHVTQTVRLTRQMQGLLRLVVATSIFEDLELDAPPVTGV
jgi:hypothetical protein